MKTFRLSLFILFCMISSIVIAATALEFKISPEEIRANKKTVVAMTMELSDQEGEDFWPLYDSYQKDLGSVNDKLDKLIDEYVSEYKALTDDRAGIIMKR